MEHLLEAGEIETLNVNNRSMGRVAFEEGLSLIDDLSMVVVSQGEAETDQEFKLTIRHDRSTIGHRQTWRCIRWFDLSDLDADQYQLFVL